MQAYTLRSAAVAALMLTPAFVRAQPAAAARRAAAQDARARAGDRLTTDAVRRLAATVEEIGPVIEANPALEARFTSSADE